MATIGDLFFKGAEALGIKTNTPEWVSLLASDQAKAEIPTDNPAEALKAFKSNFMTFEEALENQGVVNRLTTSGGAMIKERLEKSFIKWMKESGVSSDELEELVKTKDVNPEAKWQGIYSKILEAGKASVPPPKPGDKGNHDLELMKTQHAAALRELNAKLEAKEKEFADRETGWKREKATGALIDYARKNFPIAAHEIVADPFYKTLADQVLNEYEITHSTTGEIVLMDKAANIIATDPKTGNPLQVKNVLAGRIPADLLKKQDSPPTGGKTVVNGSQAQGAPAVPKTQAQLEHEARWAANK